MTTLKVFASVGVPEIVALDKVSPGGSPNTPPDPEVPAAQLQVYGPLPPEAVRRSAYGLAITPIGGATEVIANAGGGGVPLLPLQPVSKFNAQIARSADRWFFILSPPHDSWCLIRRSEIDRDL